MEHKKQSADDDSADVRQETMEEGSMSQINEKMFASDRQDWGTPQALFDKLNEEFHFNLDAAASVENHKCYDYFTIEQNALTMVWKSSTFCNPPYGRDVGRWVRKGYMESLKGNTVVMLLYARTDTQWFHEYVLGKAEIRFLKGRVKFEGAKYVEPFPSMIVIWHGDRCIYKRDDGICEKLSDGYGLLEYCVEGPCKYDTTMQDYIREHDVPSDYVRREDAAVYNPKPKSERDYQTYNLDDAYETGYEDKIKEILTLPAADVRENVRGEWDYSRVAFHCVCSNCDCAVRLNKEYIFEGYGALNFCPNCGADKRGVNDE